MRHRTMLMNLSKLLKWRLGGLALAGGLCLVFGSGCATNPTSPMPRSVETLKEACDEAIADPATAAEVHSLLTELTGIMIDRADYLESHNRRLSALLENYGATEAEIRAVIEDYNEFRAAGQNRAIEIADEVRALVTAEEWRRLEGIRTNQVQSLIDRAHWL